MTPHLTLMPRTSPVLPLMGDKAEGVVMAAGMMTMVLATPQMPIMMMSMPVGMMLISQLAGLHPKLGWLPMPSMTSSTRHAQ